jgi:hypothetical protein
MSGSRVWDWNVIVVEKHGFPRKAQEEFQVSSRSIRGATMKAKNRIAKEFSGWRVKSIWWLDPDRVRRGN